MYNNNTIKKEGLLIKSSTGLLLDLIWNKYSFYLVEKKFLILAFNGLNGSVTDFSCGAGFIGITTATGNSQLVRALLGGPQI